MTADELKAAAERLAPSAADPDALLGQRVSDGVCLAQAHLELVAERDALRAFKEYVHARLDAAGIPADPESPHKAQGCRVGGRLDIALAGRAADRLLGVKLKEGP